MSEERCENCILLEQELEVAQERIKELEKIMDEAAFSLDQVKDDLLKEL